jgi:multicomponent Na+:H+ antiporter subunit B
MTRRTRVIVFMPAAALLGFLFLWSFAGLPDFGHYRGPYGFVLNRVAVPERHTANVVNATVYDYRGFDTLGEEFILFAAATGVMLLLRREGRDGARAAGDRVRSDAVRVVGISFVGPGFLVGLWLVAFGFITPGGGFQGAVVLAASILLVFLAGSYRAWFGLVRPRAVDPVGAVGAAGYVVIGLAALISGMWFLENLLGPGKTGTLLSGGSAPFVSWAAALEVAAAFLVIFGEFLEEYIAPLARDGS